MKLCISAKSFFVSDRLNQEGGLTFRLMIPVSPFSRRLASFSSRNFRSYLFFMSKISRSASSSICFFVSSYSRKCCRDSSFACSKVDVLSKRNICLLILVIKDSSRNDGQDGQMRIFAPSMFSSQMNEREKSSSRGDDD